MIFSETSRVPLMFEKATFKRNKEGKRTAVLRFAIKLTADVALQSPAEIRAAFEAVDNRQQRITCAMLSLWMDKVNVKFYALPEEGKTPSQSMTTHLLDFVVERSEDEKAGERKEPHLFFSTVVPVEDSSNLRHWIADQVFWKLFATFDDAQMRLPIPMQPEILPVIAYAKGDVVEEAKPAALGKPRSKRRKQTPPENSHGVGHPAGAGE